jgi:hypothetical protein
MNSQCMCSFHSAAIFSSFGGPQNVKIRQKCLKASQLISSPFHKIHNPYPCYIKQYIGIPKMSIFNEKWYLRLYNLLFPFRCWSQNCDFLWNTFKQGLKYNPTLHFHYLNCIPTLFLNMHNTIFVCLFEASDHHFALIAAWQNVLVLPVGWSAVSISSFSLSLSSTLFLF